MNSEMIYKRKTMGMDNRIWFVMIALFVLLESFYAYKVIYPPKCAPLTFKIKNSGAAPGDSSFKKGDIIFFTASVDNPNIIWDFGDNTGEHQGSVVTHAFASETTFEVKAKLANCTYNVRRLTVTPREIPKLKIFTIVADDSAEVNKAVSFRCIDSAGSYEWSVKDYPDITAKGSGGGNIHTFTFPLENNTYTIECKLNNDKTQIATRTIYIKPKPIVVPKGPTITAGDVCNQAIDDQKFAALLVQVTYNAFSAGGFSQYLCNGNNTSVTVNGKQFTFGALCEKLSAIKAEDKFDKRRANAPRMRITVVIGRTDQNVGRDFVKQIIQNVKVHLEQSLSNVKGKNISWKDYPL